MTTPSTRTLAQRLGELLIRSGHLTARVNTYGARLGIWWAHGTEQRLTRTQALAIIEYIQHAEDAP